MDNIPQGDFRKNPLGGFSLGNDTPQRPATPLPPPPPPSMEIFPPEPAQTPLVAPQPGPTAPSSFAPAPSPEIKTTMPSPPPSVAVRTFPSDTESLKASGGAAPRSEPIKLDTAEDIPVFHPETTNQIPGGIASVAPRSGNKIFYIILGLLFAVGLGFVSYYFIYPLVFPATPVETPQVVAEIPAPVPEVAEPSLSPTAHQSLFVNLPTSQAQINLSELSALEIISRLQEESSKTAVPGTVKELLISLKGAPALFSEFLPVLANNLTADEIKTVVGDDFTGFLFYDDKGVWPGYVAKLRPDVPPMNAQTTFAKLESSDIRLFYTEEPGIHEEFKTGPVKGAPVRYAAFSKAGASFNYGIVGEYLVISTSFDGFTEALKYLGL